MQCRIIDEKIRLKKSPSSFWKRSFFKSIPDYKYPTRWIINCDQDLSTRAA
jgi:hypothetical protein